MGDALGWPNERVAKSNAYKNKNKAESMNSGDGHAALVGAFSPMKKSLRRVNTATTPSSFSASVGPCRKVKHGGIILPRWSFLFGPFMNVGEAVQPRGLSIHGWMVLPHGVHIGNLKM